MMPKLSTNVLAITLCLLPFTPLSTGQESKPTPPSDKDRVAAEALFTEQVRPLLVKKCYGCHADDPKKLKGELDLRTRESTLKGGISGPALVPGNAEKSLIFHAVTWKDEQLRMPPKERNRLTVKEIDLLKKWITAGAPWPKSTAQKWNDSPKGNSVVMSTSGGLSPDWTNRKYSRDDVWAYQPVQRYPVPFEGLDRKNINNPIDAFIQTKLKEKKLAPAPPADKRTLLRRVTFDLTGLPPTPDEIDAFLKDNTPQAFDKVIHRLLQSPHYGEQQARHWLDVTRYADTAGFSNDFERPNAWRYRDYVIRSFNSDKPFDRFILEQLAGDELEPGNSEMLIAVGFLRMGPWEHTGMSVANVTRQQYLDDVTNGIGTTFLAQPLRCAKCHDHKFDPIPTRDYYRIQAAFAPVQFAHRSVPFLSSENVKNFDQLIKRPERIINDARKRLAEIKQKHNRAVAKYLKDNALKSLNQVPVDNRPKRHYGLTPQEITEEKVLRKRIDAFVREKYRYAPYALSVYNGPPKEVRSNLAFHQMPKADQRKGKGQEISILLGGSLATPKDKVTPGVLTAVAGSNDTTSPSAWNTIPHSLQGRRLAFARWVASDRNPLTARVIVNRIWQQHFGKGIVTTPNNFGKMGAKPTHPELLDWLATWLVEHDWSIKKLHQLILRSATYQQSGNHPQRERLAQMDPKNSLHAFHSPRRLAAEEIRDAMLAITGELNRERGGPGVFPEINWEVALQPRHIMGSTAPAYQPSPKPEDRNRRTIYAFRHRTLPDPMLEVLNRPGADVSCPKRDETTVVTQVFSIFNGQTVHDRALALAHGTVKNFPEDNQRLDHLYRNVHGRLPTAEERRLCLAHVAKMLIHHKANEPKPVAFPTTVRRRMIEELTGTPVEWTEELDLMKTHQPDLKPWNVGPEVRAWKELCLVMFSSNEFFFLD